MTALKRWYARTKRWLFGEPPPDTHMLAQIDVQVRRLSENVEMLRRLTRNAQGQRHGF